MLADVGHHSNANGDDDDVSWLISAS